MLQQGHSQKQISWFLDFGGLCIEFGPFFYSSGFLNSEQIHWEGIEPVRTPKIRQRVARHRIDIHIIHVE